MFRRWREIRFQEAVRQSIMRATGVKDVPLEGMPKNDEEFEVMVENLEKMKWPKK